jgi:hypothetical protein
MRKRERIQLIASLSVIFLSGFGRCYAEAENTEATPTVALCKVLAHPTDYSGKTITITVHIASTKEGTFLWSASCRNLVLALQIEDQARSDESIRDLLQMLRQHGLSDHPVTATLTGLFLHNNQRGNSNRHRSVFRVRSASEIKQAEPKSAKASPDITGERG